MYIGKNNGNLIETKRKSFLCQHIFQPFLKIGKFLLDMTKCFLIMSNLYLVEILSEPKSLIIEETKKYSKWEIMCLFWVIFFSQRESGIFSALSLLLEVYSLDSSIAILISFSNLLIARESNSFMSGDINIIDLSVFLHLASGYSYFI